MSKSRKGITQIQMMIITVVAVVIVAAGVYWYMSMQAGSPTPTEQANMAIARGMWEAVSRGDISSLPDKVWASNFKRYLSPTAAPLDTAGQIKRLNGFHAAFTNFNLSVVDLVAHGDRVTGLLMFTGKQTGAFMGIPPTNKTGTIRFIEEVRIVDGKIVEQWGGPDWSDMVQQLGAVISATDANKALARSMWDAVSTGNLNALDNIYSSDYKRYLSATAAPLTAAQQKARLTGLRTAFPDLNLKIEDMSAEGDRVSVRMTVTGTQLGTFSGIAPTGKKVTIAAYEVVRIANGKIVEHWGGPDTYDLLTQLGAKFSAGP